MSEQQLRTLAFFSAGVALLAVFAVAISGNSLLLSSTLRFVLQDTRGNAAAVASASQTFSVPGTYSWTAPANVTSVLVTVIGGGGGGNAGQAPDDDGGCDCFTAGGGGSGGAIVNQTVAVTPGQTYPVVVGAGGIGSPHRSVPNCPGYFTSSSDGQDSYFGNVRATGGGSANSSGAAGTPGGSPGCPAIGVTPPGGPFSTCGGSNGTSYGGGGGGGGCYANGGSGGSGYVSITAQYVFNCSVTFDQNPIQLGQSTTMRWTSVNAGKFSINNYGDVAVPSGSAIVSPSVTTDYTGTIRGSNNAPVTIVLTSGSSWTVPDDWDPIKNTVEVIGGGGTGGVGGDGTDGTPVTGGCVGNPYEGFSCSWVNGYSGSPGGGGAGGGGGAYAITGSLNLTPGSHVPYGVGLAGGTTWFGTATAAGCTDVAVCVKAQGGSSSGLGGQAAASIGLLKYNGGNGAGGAGSLDFYTGGAGGGGGGAAGGIGRGGDGGVNYLWGGAGGVGNGGAGGTAASGNGGTGAAPLFGSAYPAGIGGKYGGGGGGGGGGIAGAAGVCRDGNDPGCGGFGNDMNGGPGGSGGPGGAGGQGVVVITYTPAPKEICPATLAVNSNGAPTITLTASGSNPTIASSHTAVVGDVINILATFAPVSPDTLVATAITDFQHNPWCGTNCVDDAATIEHKIPLTTRTGSFVPSAPGVYAFHGAAQTSLLPAAIGQASEYGSSLLLTVSCPSGQIDNGSGVCIVDNSVCPGPNQDVNNSCNCVPGFHDSDPGVGRTCVVDTTSCSGPHEDPNNSCNCINPYQRVAGVCVIKPTISLFSIDQSKVRSGNAATINWTVTGLIPGGDSTCTISSNTNGFSQSMPVPNPGATWSGSHVSTGALTKTTTFTLTCSNGSTQSRTVGIIPGVIEI